MAMNKKEQAELTRMTDELRRSYALGWSKLPVPERSVKPPTDRKLYSEGWDINYYIGGFHGAPQAEIGWSTFTSHGSGRAPKENNRDISRSQNGRSYFATKLDALISQRLDAEYQCAKILAQIDQRIEKERLSPTPINPNP